jgi:hypothetical protein
MEHHHPTQPTWRSQLGQLLLDRPTRARVLDELGIHPQTLRCWISGETTPHEAMLSSLLQALPQHREHLLALMRADPHIGPDFLQEEVGRRPKEIPATFYREALRLWGETPRRFRDQCSLVLHMMLSQLDPGPRRIGVHLIIARLMPARSDAEGIPPRVRSLSQVVGMGTYAPLTEYLRSLHYFLGSESLAGYALTTGHGEDIPDTREATNLLPVHSGYEERAVAAYPIKRGGYFAGALIISSREAHSLDQQLELIEQYADLLGTVFADSDFVDHAQIELGEMPPWFEQQEYFANFRARVEEAQRAAVGEGSLIHDVLQLQEQVRAEFEGELLQLQALKRAGAGADSPRTATRVTQGAVQ